MNPKGFTLVEILIAVLLVGLAIASLVGGNAALTMANGAGADMSTAEFLAEQIRELIAMVAMVDPETTPVEFGAEEASMADYDDVDDFDGMVFSPPINATRAQLSAFTGFSQRVTVENVSASDFEQVVTDNSSDFVRVTVEVQLNGKSLSTVSWIRANY